MQTIYSTCAKTRLILLFRFRRSTNVAQTAHFFSCWACLVRTSASCLSFFGRALSLFILQQCSSFHHPHSKTLRYVEHSQSCSSYGCSHLFFLFFLPPLERDIRLQRLPSQLCINITDAWTTKHASDACTYVAAHHVEVLICHTNDTAYEICSCVMCDRQCIHTCIYTRIHTYTHICTDVHCGAQSWSAMYIFVYHVAESWSVPNMWCFL